MGSFSSVGVGGLGSGAGGLELVMGTGMGSSGDLFVVGGTCWAGG